MGLRFKFGIGWRKLSSALQEAADLRSEVEKLTARVGELEGQVGALGLFVLCVKPYTKPRAKQRELCLFGYKIQAI